jgi:phosphopantothenoylcysteine decarboxylase
MQATYRDQQPWARLQAIASASPDRGGGAAVGSTDAAALRIWRDNDEWDGYTSVGTDAVVHVELAKRNKLLLIAPLCANTLAAAALGSCGNLLTSVLRAWYYDLAPEFAQPLAERYGAHAVARPVLVAPAMNTFMWHQRVTSTHLGALQARGVRVVPPVAKRLACGDVGVGAMAEVADVVEAALGMLRDHKAAEDAANAQGKPEFVA